MFHFTRYVKTISTGPQNEHKGMKYSQNRVVGGGLCRGVYQQCYAALKAALIEFTKLKGRWLQI